MSFFNNMRNQMKSRFVKIFLPISIFVVFTVLILTWIISLVFINLQKESIGQQHQMSLNLVSSFYEQMRYNEFPLLSQLFDTKEIQEYLFHKNDNRYDAAIKIKPILERLVIQNAYIHSVYLYNGDYGYYSSYAGYEKDKCLSNPSLPSFIEEGIDKASNLTLRRTTFVNTSEHNLSESKENLYSLKIAHLSNNPCNTYALIVNISESIARQFFTSDITQFEKSFFILDKKGTFLSHPNEEEFATKIQENTLFSKILELKGESRLIVLKDKGSSYYVSWVDQEVMGWRFIFIIPYLETIQSLLNVIKLVVLFVIAFIIVIGIISIIISKKLDKALSFERRLISYIVGEGDIVKISKTEKLYSLALFRLSFSNKYYTLSGHEKNLLKMKVLKLSELTLLHKQFGYILPIANTSFMVISSQAPNSIYDRLNAFLAIVKKEVDAEMTAIVVENEVSEKEFPTEYSQLAKEMKNQFLINKDGVDYYKEYDYKFPKFKFNDFEIALRDKDKEAFEKSSEVLFEKLYESPSWIFFDIIKMNLLSIASLYLSNEIDLYYLGGFTRFSNQINHVEEIVELEKIFKSIKNLFNEMAVDVNNTENDELINLIDKYIDDNLKDNMLNAAMVADYVSLSLNYTRTYYKQNTGISLNEAIGQRRLLLSADLLLNTSQTVDEIRTIVGFANYPYFCTYFKNYFGVTPSYYRRFRGKTE